MKTSATLLFFLLATVCLGQVTFDNALASKASEITYTTSTSLGTLVTISTNNGFSWVISDALADSYEVYATLICVSTGSTTDTGIAARSTFPDSYSVQSQVLPVFGDHFPNTLYADTIAFYSPVKPTLAVGVSMDPVVSTYDAGQTIHFVQTSSSDLEITLNGQTTSPQDMSSYSNLGLNFELLNCGKAVWCIQTAAQFLSSAGVCTSGTAPTCPVPTTCSSPEYQTDCSTSSNIFIKDFSCLTQCPAGYPRTSVTEGVSVCGPCTDCESGSGAGTTAKSQGFAAWKLSLAIALPVIAVAMCCFIAAGIGARRRRLQKEENKKFNQIPSHPTSPTVETLHTQV